MMEKYHFNLDEKLMEFFTNKEIEEKDNLKYYLRFVIGGSCGCGKTYLSELIALSYVKHYPDKHILLIYEKSLPHNYDQLKEHKNVIIVDIFEDINHIVLEYLIKGSDLIIFDDYLNYGDFSKIKFEMVRDSKKDLIATSHISVCSRFNNDGFYKVNPNGNIFIFHNEYHNGCHNNYDYGFYFSDYKGNIISDKEGCKIYFVNNKMDENEHEDFIKRLKEMRNDDPDGEFESVYKRYLID